MTENRQIYFFIIQEVLTIETLNFDFKQNFCLMSDVAERVSGTLCTVNCKQNKNNPPLLL